MTTEASVIRLIAKELGEQHMAANRVEEIKPSYLLDEDLGCNSIDYICIAARLDEEFKVEIPDDDVANWATVGDVVRSVERLRVVA